MLVAINSDRMDNFYGVAEKYLKTLASGSPIGYRVRRLLDEKPRKLMQLSALPSEIKKLINPVTITEDNVFLNPLTKVFIDELLIEWKNIDTYKFHNLGVRNKMLLHGPTGNGKTTIAKHISKLTGLPFVEVNSDYIIDSHLGKSSINIHKLFNELKEPCVLFWDEIDSIGRKRGLGTDSAAGMENERTINSILVNLEKLDNQVIFIGATNRKEILDSAFLRRFDIMWELATPSVSEKENFATQMKDYYKLPNDFMPENIDGINNFSEIKMRYMELARKYVLTQLTEK